MALSWEEHAKRNRCTIWPGHFLKHQNNDWLGKLRLAHNSVSEHAGILGLRAQAARPVRRYEEGLDFIRANAVLQQMSEVAAIPKRVILFMRSEEFAKQSYAFLFGKLFDAHA